MCYRASNELKWSGWYAWMLWGQAMMLQSAEFITKQECSLKRRRSFFWKANKWAKTSMFFPPRWCWINDQWMHQNIMWISSDKHSLLHMNQRLQLQHERVKVSNINLWIEVSSDWSEPVIAWRLLGFMSSHPA